MRVDAPGRAPGPGASDSVRTELPIGRRLGSRSRRRGRPHAGRPSASPPHGSRSRPSDGSASRSAARSPLAITPEHRTEFGSEEPGRPLAGTAFPVPPTEVSIVGRQRENDPLGFPAKHRAAFDSARAVRTAFRRLHLRQTSCYGKKEPEKSICF